MWNERYAGDRCSVWRSAAFKNLFGGTPAPPPTPVITPPPVMPVPNSPASIAAGNQAAAQAAAGGRNSTVLTSAPSRAGGTLAGSAYSGAKLGSG